MENKIELVHKDNQLIVFFYGEIDSSVAPKYRAMIDVEIEKEYCDVLFDFKNTSFIDSSGIGLVLGRYNMLKDHGCCLVLTSLNKTAYRLFELTGIFKIMAYKEEIVC